MQKRIIKNIVLEIDGMKFSGNVSNAEAKWLIKKGQGAFVEDVPQLTKPVKKAK